MEEEMSRMAAGTARYLGPVALMVVALGMAGAGWAQQRPPAGPTCDRAQAGVCIDQKVVECQNLHKGNQSAIGQCQMQQNMACNTAANCPNSAQ
jgi:hypothetical protein